MPTSSKNERTRAGCWTCRGRRKKCDETRPHCLSCASLGLQCEGYDFRLKWGLSRAKVSTITSRNVRIKQAQSRSPSTASPQEHTSSSQALIYHLGKDLYQSLTPLQLEIMQSCTYQPNHIAAALRLTINSHRLGSSYPRFTNKAACREIL